jgi:O-antigen ligase
LSLAAAALRERADRVDERGWLARSPSPLMMAALVAGASLIVGVAAALGPWVGLGVVSAIALGLAVLWRPALGGLALVALVPVTSGLRRGLPIPGVRLSEALILAVAALVLVPAGRRQTVPWLALDWLTLAFVGGSVTLGLLGLVRNRQPFTAESVGSLVGPLQFVLLYRTVRTALATPRRRRQALRLALSSSVAVSLISVLQQLDVGPARRLVGSLTGSQVFASWGYRNFPRATGPFPHWLPLAGYLLVILLLASCLLLDPEGRLVLRPSLLAAVLATAAAAMVLSLTLAGFFGVVAGALLLGHWAGRFRFVLTCLVGSAVLATLLFWPFVAKRFEFQFGGGGARNPLVAESIAYRVDIWTHDYLPALSGWWLAGYGPVPPAEIHWKATESQYVTLVLRGGLPLLALYGALLWGLVVHARGLLHHPEVEQRVLARVVVATVIVLLPMQLVFPYFTNSGLPQLFWLLPAMLAAGSAPAPVPRLVAARALARC